MRRDKVTKDRLHSEKIKREEHWELKKKRQITGRLKSTEK
jgi:hypothetical protein